MEQPKEQPRLRIVHYGTVHKPTDTPELNEVCKYCHRILFGPCSTDEEAGQCCNFNQPAAIPKQEKSGLRHVKKKGQKDDKHE